jgi:hypothetical protein
MIPNRYKNLVIQLNRWYLRHPRLFVMMRFIKANWFWIGLIALIAFGFYRKNLNVNIGSGTAPKTEKYTAAPPTVPTASTMSIMGGGGGIVPMQAVDEATTKAFLLRFGKVTKGEHQKFGLKASAMLALAYVNSFGGQRNTVGTARNFYALRCGGGWTNGGTDINGQCFRLYATPWESFRDASNSIMAHEWCQQAIKDNSDWQTWVRLLAQHGCSDVQNAETEMTNIIQRYKMWELDGK